MNDLDALLRQHPVLRDADPALVREALQDRTLFDRLVDEGDAKLSDAERRGLEGVRMRVLERIRAGNAHPAQPQSWLATRSGWRLLQLDDLPATLAASAMAALSPELLAHVFGPVSTAGIGVLDAPGLAVSLVDRDTGHTTPCDECAVEIRDRLHLASAAGGDLRLTGTLACELLREEQATALRGGTGLLGLVDAAGRASLWVAARLTEDDHELVLQIDHVLPGVATLPAAASPLLRLLLIPPSELARGLVES